MNILTFGGRRLNISVHFEQVDGTSPEVTERAYLARELRESIERERRVQELRHLTRPRVTF